MPFVVIVKAGQALAFHRFGILSERLSVRLFLGGKAASRFLFLGTLTLKRLSPAEDHWKDY